MEKYQCPNCKGNRVTMDNEFAMCLKCGLKDYLFDYRNAHDEPMPAPAPDTSEIEDRIANLEEMSSERGSIPRRYYDEFQQIKGELAYLRNKLAETGKKREPAKSAYKGLDIER